MNNLDKSIMIIISRYNEYLEWLKEDSFNKYNAIIYNKGINDNYYNSPKIINKIKLKNVGRCDHTYLFHIINNYDNLADINIFLPGSVNLKNKINRSKKLIYEIEKNNSSVFLYNEKRINVKSELYNFTIETHIMADDKNKEINSESKTQLSDIRPFGLWYENIFNNILINHISYGGLFSVSKEDILKHPKTYYESLIEKLSISSNPEVGHYFERSWEAVFYPMNTKFIEG